MTHRYVPSMADACSSRHIRVLLYGDNHQALDKRLAYWQRSKRIDPTTVEIHYASSISQFHLSWNEALGPRFDLIICQPCYSACFAELLSFATNAASEALFLRAVPAAGISQANPHRVHHPQIRKIEAWLSTGEQTRIDPHSGNHQQWQKSARY